MSDQVISFGPEMLQAQVKELNSLIAQIKAAQGTAAERLRKAGLEALGVKFNEDQVKAWKSMVKGASAVQDIGALATFVQSVDEWAAQVHDEARTAILRGTSDSAPNVDGLKATFEGKRDAAKAMALLLTQAAEAAGDSAMKTAVSKITIPDLRGAGGSAGGTASKKGVTVKKLAFYHEDDTGRHYEPDSQNKLSSMAWYYGARVTGRPGQGSKNEGKGIPTSELITFLQAQGVTVDPATHAWSVTVEDGGFTIGAEEVTPTS